MSVEDEDSRKRKIALVAMLFILLLFVSCLGIPLLGGSGDLTVDVVDEDGDPINNANVRLDSGQAKNTGGQSNTAVFKNVAPGSHNVSANATWYETNSTDVYVDGDTSVTVVLTRDSDAPSKLSKVF